MYKYTGLQGFAILRSLSKKNFEEKDERAHEDENEEDEENEFMAERNKSETGENRGNSDNNEDCIYSTQTLDQSILRRVSFDLSDVLSLSQHKEDEMKIEKQDDNAEHEDISSSDVSKRDEHQIYILDCHCQRLIDCYQSDEAEPHGSIEGRHCHDTAVLEQQCARLLSESLVPERLVPPDMYKKDYDRFQSGAIGKGEEGQGRKGRNVEGEDKTISCDRTVVGNSPSSIICALTQNVSIDALLTPHLDIIPEPRSTEFQGRLSGTLLQRLQEEEERGFEMGHDREVNRALNLDKMKSTVDESSVSLTQVREMWEVREGK